MRMLALIAEHAQASPSSVAIEGPRGDVVTYQAMIEYAGRVAAAFRTRGLVAGDRVCLVLPRSVGLVLVQLGALQAGVVFAPLEPEQPPERLRSMCAQLSPALVVAAGGPAPTWTGVDVVSPEELLDPTGPALPAAPLPAGAPAYCLFTSGSTGVPTGVLVSRAALDVYVDTFRTHSGCVPSDRAAHLGSPGFDVTVEEVWPFLASGATVVIAGPRTCPDPAALVRWVTERRITTAFVPPLMLDALFRAPRAPSRLRLVRTGGERVTSYPPVGVGYSVRNEYGPTETTVAATWCELSRWTRREHPPPIGLPLPHVRLRLCDEHGHDVGSGEVGELHIGGPTVAIGYLGNPELTARRFVTGPDGSRYFRTGDLVRRLPSGHLAYAGRRDQQVQVLGKRVELGEIETALAEHDAVCRAAVLARQDQQGRTRELVAFVQPSNGRTPGCAALRRFLAARLPAHMVPTEVHELDDFPTTSSGKVDRATLASMLNRDDLTPDAARHHATGPALETLVVIWREVLADNDAGTASDLFELGGTSLHALEVVALVHERLGAQLSVRDVFERPSPTGLLPLVETSGVRS